MIPPIVPNFMLLWCLGCELMFCNFDLYCVCSVIVRKADTLTNVSNKVILVQFEEPKVNSLLLNITSYFLYFTNWLLVLRTFNMH